MKKELFEQYFNQLTSKLPSICVSEINPLFERQYNPLDGMQSYQLDFVASVLNKLEQIVQDEVIVSECKKIVLLGYLLKNWSELNDSPNAIILANSYRDYLHRIYQLLLIVEKDPFPNMDIYWKELAIARLQFMPLHSSVAEFYSGFGLKQGLSLSVVQSIKFLLFSLKYGRKPYYRIHLHVPLLNDFTSEGWEASYLQIAELLNHNKNIKGVVRSSWFFDPEIRKISPNLSYLQNLPLSNGAVSFYQNPDITGSALAKSKTRRELFDEGKYKPMNYLLVWPRNALIEWADEKLNKQ